LLQEGSEYILNINRDSLYKKSIFLFSSVFIVIVVGCFQIINSSSDSFNHIKLEPKQVIETNSSTQEDDMDMKDSYMKYGYGPSYGVQENNVYVFKVKVTSVSDYSKDTLPGTSGKQTDYFTLKKDNDNAPWLIYDSGKP